MLRLGLMPLAGRSVFTFEALEALHQHLHQHQQDSDCRVILLEGSEGEFCSGMDLEAVANNDPNTEAGIRLYGAIAKALRLGPQAVVSLVDGKVAAGGVGLVAVADVAMATARSTFGLSEVMLGFLPSMVLPLLMERMPPQKARWMALGIEPLTAERACHFGLLDQVVADAAALGKALRSTLKQLLRLSPGAVRELKGFSQEVGRLAIDRAIDTGADKTADAVSREETLAVLRGFIEGQPPPWFARYRPQKARASANRRLEGQEHEQDPE